MRAVTLALLACTAAYAPPRRHNLRLRSVRAVEASQPLAEPSQPSRLAAALRPTKGPLDADIAAVALPAMLSLVVFPVVGMVDTFFIGRMGSAIALAGQGAANAAFNFCFFVLAVVPTLTAPRVARAAARGDQEAVRATARESLWIAGAVGLCGTLALVGWPRYFLRLVLPQNAPAMAPAARYLRYRSLGYLPALLSSTCFAAFRGLLDTTMPLRISLFYNALNALLDPILIFGCGMGVAGAALATAVAESVGCIFYLEALSKKLGGRRLLPTFWRRPPARATVKALAAGAAAMQVRQIALNAAFGAATRSAQAMDATGVMAAAYSISQQLWLLAGVALFALQSSAAALVPAALGKGDTNALGKGDTNATDQAQRVADRCLGWGLYSGIGLGLLQIACLPLVRCFSPLPAVRAATRAPTFLSALAQPINGVAFVAEGVLLGLGAFKFLAAQTAVGALVMMGLLSRAKTLSQVIYAICWFNGIQAALSLFHHVRLSPLALRTPVSKAPECAVVAVDGGRPDLVCVVEEEEEEAP